MRFWYLFALLIVELLFWIQTAHAASPVISEVMWPGSDLSSSDEWFEITLPVCSSADVTCSDATVDLSAWTVHYLKSTGQEALMITFPSGLALQPGQYLVIAHFNADGSRLLAEPALVNSAVSLLNTGLKLKLKDQAGTVIDEVDDGVGAPFAGANPSSPGTKASMERINLEQSGTVKENWRTATTVRGLDTGANMLGTPGFENGSSESISSSSASPSSASSSSSFSSSSSSSSSSESSVSSVSSESSSSQSSSSSSCDLIPAITLQSGSWTGVAKVTLNVQATAAAGTMAGATCDFDFGDGYQVDSCNPGVHTYDHAGSFLLTLAVKNQCGNTLIQTQSVEVTPSSTVTSSSATVPGSPVPFDGAHLVISGVLPNPDAKDKDKEWIEIRNLEDRAVSVAGWHLVTGIKTIRRFVIDAVSQIPARDTIRLYQLESGLELTNAAGRVQLINPLGTIVSSVSWDKAEEGRVFLSDSFKDGSLKGSVTRVLDPVTFTVSLDGPSSKLLGQESVRVKLIGVQRFHSGENSRFLPYESNALEFVRALLEKKNCELLFDADVWTADGVLQAYVLTDLSASLQKQLLLSGFISADTSSLYTARQEYMDAQQKAIQAKAGFWSLGIIPSESKSIGALNENKKIASIIDTAYAQSSTNSGRILITEVFPSPLAPRSPPRADEVGSPEAQVAREDSGSILASEWLEFFNPSSESLSLRGWTLSIGKKTITFGPSSIVDGGKHVIVLAHQLGLKLKNEGDSIELQSPSKVLVASVTYPKIKNGQSYVYDERTESYCMSKSPSAGKSGSCATALIHSPVSATAKNPKAKTTSPRKSVYDKYAANYNRGLGNTEQKTIMIGSPESGSSSSSLMLIMGALLGGLVSFGLLKISGFRKWLEIEPKQVW